MLPTATTTGDPAVDAVLALTVLSYPGATFRNGCEIQIGGAEGPGRPNLSPNCPSASPRLRVALDHATTIPPPGYGTGISGTVCRCGTNNALAEFNVAIVSLSRNATDMRVVFLIRTEPGAAVFETHLEYVILRQGSAYIVDDIRCANDDPATSIYVQNPPMCP